jgi:uncharacterized protein involved in exopolysaccharide biosynthesis
MRRIVVTNDPHSYLISIAITTGNPRQAANLVNAVALEYLRHQTLQQLVEAQHATEREIEHIASTYGERHPSYLLTQARLENLQTRLKALQDDSPVADALWNTPGQAFIPAEAVMVPSGPNIVLVLGLTIGAALAGGICLALLLGPVRPVRRPLAAPRERTVEPTQDATAAAE